MNQSRSIVIANCNCEDVGWASQLRPAWEVCLASPCLYRPAGRESAAYLDFIVGRKWRQEGTVVFCQGNPFNHGDPRFLDHLHNPEISHFGGLHECDPTGLPEEPGLRLHSWCDVLGLDRQERFRFSAGSQYRVKWEEIASRPRSFYTALYHLTKIPENRGAWALERLWPVIWRLEL